MFDILFIDWIDFLDVYFVEYLLVVFDENIEEDVIVACQFRFIG
jgi:hypothetical protein